MTDNTETAKKSEAPAKEEGELFLFPREGVTVRAKDLEEATKLYNKTLKDNKESDND